MLGSGGKAVRKVEWPSPLGTFLACNKLVCPVSSLNSAPGEKDVFLKPRGELRGRFLPWYADQWFSNLNEHQHHLEDLLKLLNGTPAPTVSDLIVLGGIWESAFLGFPDDLDADAVGITLWEQLFKTAIAFSLLDGSKEQSLLLKAYCPDEPRPC